MLSAKISTAFKQLLHGATPQEIDSNGNANEGSRQAKFPIGLFPVWS